MLNVLFAHKNTELDNSRFSVYFSVSKHPKRVDYKHPNSKQVFISEELGKMSEQIRYTVIGVDEALALEH